MLALGKSFTSLMVLWMLIFPLLCSFKHAGDKLSLDTCVAGGGCPLSASFPQECVLGMPPSPRAAATPRPLASVGF